MKGYGQRYRSAWLLVILLILGGLAGGLIGQALSSVHHLAFLNQGPGIGLPATTLNLDFLTLTFGFTFKVNPVSILGFIVAFIIYLRL
jgi:riboflavin transporter FmnP